jgi:hypothetical protein
MMGLSVEAAVSCSARCWLVELRRIVLASANARVPSLWSDAELITQAQLAALTPPGCVRRAMAWTQTISNMQANGRSVMDILRYGDTSVWWFMQTLIFSFAKEAILTIERSERLLDHMRPGEVFVAGFGNRGALIASVFRREGIHCTLPRGLGLLKDENLSDEADSAEYMHPNTARSNSEQGCPIPTKTAVGAIHA